VAKAEGGDPLPANQMTKIIGGVLAELDKIECKAFGWSGSGSLGAGQGDR